MAKFNLWKSSKDSKYYWHLYSDRNYKVVCWAEGYNTKQAAEDSINWVKINAESADIVEE